MGIAIGNFSLLLCSKSTVSKKVIGTFIPPECNGSDGHFLFSFQASASTKGM